MISESLKTLAIEMRRAGVVGIIGIHIPPSAWEMLKDGKKRGAGTLVSWEYDTEQGLVLLVEPFPSMELMPNV